MRRTSILVALTSAALAGSLTTGAPTASQAALERSHYKPWGSTRAPVQVLRAGCNYYRYHYHIDPPAAAKPRNGGSGGTAEIFLIKPNGRPLASAAFDLKVDPKKDWARWRICRPSTSYGRHKMRMKVSFFDENRNLVEGWVRPGTMRLVRP